MSTKDDLKFDEKVKIDIQPPKLWKVVFLNDDVTPMELVIELLQNIFNHDVNSAKKVTLEVHNTGSGIAGIYNLEIAEELSLQATRIARANGSPLRIQVEEE